MTDLSWISKDVYTYLFNAIYLFIPFFFSMGTSSVSQMNKNTYNLLNIIISQLDHLHP